jgi:general secretion pathway protein L
LRETFYLRLQSTASEDVTAFCIAGPGAAHSWPVENAPLRDALARVGDRRLVVLVPAADVRLLRVSVAARSAAKILQAAPYMLEDQLADDVEDLHFALGPRLADGSHAVAAVARVRMDEWLAPLRAAQLRPDLLLPELLCLPLHEDGAWSALAEPDQIIVRTGATGGFSCTADDLPLMLQLADPERRQRLRIAVPRGVAADFTRLEWPLELLPGHSSALEALLHGHAPAQDIDLLQGDYSQTEGARRALAPWRLPAALAAGCLLTAGLSHAVHAFTLGRALDQQQQQNEQRFRSLFPSETRIVDLAVQLDQQTVALKGGAASGGFLSLTETLTRALSAAPGFTVEGLQFREGALYVNLTGTDLQQLDQLQNWFQQNPETRYERQSVNSGTEGVQIRIRLGGA